MTIKIFEVRIATYAVVVAKDETHAREVARRHAIKILDDDGDTNIDVIREVKTIQDLEHGWDGDCLPYGGDEETILSKLLEPNGQGKPPP